MKRLPPFDKYEYYINSVQNPPVTADFLERAFREAFGEEPRSLREDFCGTFALCCEWVDRGSQHTAAGVDLDPEPLRYGGEHYLSQLGTDAQRRIRLYQRNVLSPSLPRADVIAAMNFSYFSIQDRSLLLQYFRQCRRKLAPRGVLVLDCFGGIETQGPLEEETEYDDFTYFWDQVSFDPVTHRAKFYIHYKRRREKKRLRVFTYDWRMWTLPELRDCLREAGFDDAVVYWEGTNKKGEGDGRFRRVVSPKENCEAWVAYVVGIARP